MGLNGLRKGLVVAVAFGLSSVVDAGAQDLASRLRQADRLAWLTDWYTALPVYSEVEKAATRGGNRRDALYAKFGRLRGQMQTLPLPDISEEIAVDLETPLARRDPRLRLRGLTVKGEIDLEWDVQAAQRDWEEIRELARELREPGWENRANGELGIIAFLKGNTGEATGLVQQALSVATKTGDVGGQLRYMGTIANGLLLAGYTTQATGYVDRALKFSAEHPEVGFPFVVYSTKVLTLLAVDQADDAERFARTAMVEARAGDRRIKEVELLMLLARISKQRGRPAEAIQHLEQAVAKAAAGQVRRLHADAESLLADAYRSQGDLTRARRHALAAVAESQAAGSRFTLPVHLRILAEVLAAQGSVAEANRVYNQAADIVDGIMVNVPSREAQARLIGVRSNLYEGHFRLVAGSIGDPAQAYEVIERARGRAAADVLRAPAGEGSRTPDAVVTQARTISLLQTRLLRARQPGERSQLLDQLWEAEQRNALPGSSPKPDATGGRTIALSSVRQQLSPDELILEYVVTEPRSYCLVISRRGVRLVALQPRSSIEREVDQFTSALKGATTGSAPLAKALFEALLQPIPESQTAKRLFVVPDGTLNLVPFDALLSLNGAAASIVSTVPSANVFFLLRTRPPGVDGDGPLLAIGGVPYEQMFDSKTTGTSAPNQNRGLFDVSYPSSLPALASARAEVQSAARALGPSSVVLTGEEATESALKAQDLGRFGILHFAAHAFADPKFPERAAIVLLNDAAAAQDGLLQPREIAQLRLRAGVVVLSACETAVGPTLGQEGVLNIARGFLLAGAQSVIMTLWPVADATSAALMRRFYEHIAAGQDVAQALTRSKTAVLEQFGAAALPSVAAFQLVGVGDYRLSASRAGAYE